MSGANTLSFKRLVEPHLDALYRAAFRLVRNDAEAQDLVQETCIRAYQHISELDESRHVKGWLLRVLHNVFVDDARRARRSPVTSLEEAGISSSPCPNLGPEEVTYAMQREEQLARAWSKLERDQRVLLALRAEGYGLSEIAEITGAADTALSTRLYRARQSFARYLAREAESEHRREVAK
jgi:RNA polymerase sigma-70 factor (ECF subfamily)